MDRIHYAGDTFLTGTAIAEAVLQYAKVLAQNESSDSVDIPVYDPASGTSRASFLIGPASQIASRIEKTDIEEIVDEELLADLAERTALLGHAAAVPGPESAAYDLLAVDDLDI